MADSASHWVAEKEEEFMIKLYGVPGSRAMRSLWMLEEVGVPYENVKTHFVGGTRTPEYLKINPNGKIPALQDGELILWESLAINLYLGRKYDKGLWPKTIEGEGHAFKWSIWAMTEAEGPVLQALLHRTFLPEDQRDPKKAEEGAQNFQAPLKVLDDALAGRQCLLGDTFTVADLNVASVVGWAPMAGIDLSSVPNAAAWLGRCTARPAYGRVMALMR
jgi:glutathione S-transferase